MELSSKARNDLRDLMNRTIYLTEKSLYRDLFDIISSDLDYYHDVEVVITDDYYETDFNIEKRVLTISPEENYDYCKKLAYSWRELLKDDDIEEFTKYAIALVVLHESTHAEQSACAYDDYSSNREINRMYRRIFDYDEWYNIVSIINYKLRGETFSFERKANIDSYKEMLNIVPQKFQCIYKLNYLYNFFKNYDAKYGKLITPVRKTFKMVMGKYDIISEGIPLNERIDHGLDLDILEYNTYIRDMNNQGIEESTYDNLQKILGKK